MPHDPTPRGRKSLALLAGVVVPISAIAVLNTPAAFAGDALSVTSTTTARVQPGGTATLSGLSVSGAASSSDLDVTVSTDVGSLNVADHDDVTLAYGNNWSGDASVTFDGTPDEVNEALASVQLTQAASSGTTAHITVNALPHEDGMVYSPSNGHYYQFVADPTKNITWTQAQTAAASKTFLGQSGYLATIPNSTVNDLITSKIPGALNVWIGAESTDDPDASDGTPTRVWEWVNGPLAGTVIDNCTNWQPTTVWNDDPGDPIFGGMPTQVACDDTPATTTYSNWSSGEPNNSQGASTPHSGEWVAVTNWGSASGLWNDLPDSDVDAGGYVVEYGDDATGSSGFTGTAAATSDVQIVDVAGAPTGVSATRGNGKATVTFTAPTDTGGSTIANYTVTAQPGNITKVCSGSPCDVTGLTNGTAYTFSVHANNDEGAGVESDQTSSVTPATVPSAPANVTATREDGKAVVNFDAPANGGSAITGYKVTSHPGGAVTHCATTSCEISGLTNGTAYTFTVVATNDVGDSAASDGSAEVTPAAKPGVPTGVSVTRDGTSAQVTFTAPTSTGGIPLTGYVVTLSPGGQTYPCDHSPCTITGLDESTAYTATVKATNDAGTGAASDAADVLYHFDQVGTPAITGPAVEGSTLTAHPGDWEPTDGVTYDYQWFADGSPISGATGQTHVLTGDEVGSTITVQVTAHRAAYADATSEASDETSTVLAAFDEHPAPTIRGTTVVGNTLTAVDGEWAPADATLTHQWLVDGQPIDGATGDTLTLTEALAGHTITVRTTATHDGYASVSETSEATDAVLNAFTMVTDPTIAGTVVNGSTLTANTGIWAPSADSFTYQWFADGEPIDGVTGSSLILGPDQVGKTITVTATGHKAGYADATSDSSSATAKVLDALTATPAPQVTGTVKVGSTLSLTDGDWAPSDTVRTHQWYANGQPIDGATGDTLLLTPDLLGKTITVSTTGSKSGYAPVSVDSAQTTAVAQGDWSKTSEATMTGSSALGGTITAVPQHTTQQPDSYAYRWFAAGKRVAGASSETFVGSKKYAGQRISVEVTAVKAGYPDIVSTTTGSHPVGTFWRNAAPTISGTVRSGAVVKAVVDTTQWAPAPTSVSYSWWIDGKRISGATKASYRIPAKYKRHQLAVHVIAKKAGYPLQTERFSPRSTIK